MTDIQHWRRMVQPAKGRKSAEPEDDASVATRRGLRPVLSSYFNHYSLSSASNRFIATYRPSEETLIDYRLPSRLADHYVSPPDIDILMDQVMIHLLDHPFQNLDSRFNGTILRIFESYRELRDEKVQLESQVHDQSYSYKSITGRLKDAQSQWHEERQDYKAEIKRLEVLLAQGNGGLAEVTLARQNSVLRQKQQNRAHGKDDGLEAVLEALEKGQRREDKVYDAQRATFRKRRPSPSADMRRLSRKLTMKKSMMNLPSDLPVGTPPNTKPTISLAARAHQDDLRDARVGTSHTDRSASDVRTSCSEDSYSEYSCAGELPRNEASDGTLVERSADDDMTMIKQMAQTVAQRRNIDVAEIIPKLLALFEVAPASGSTVTRDSKSDAVGEVGRTVVPKQHGLIQKASGFFHKKTKPPPIKSTQELLRRFSFEAGDDTKLLIDSALPVRQLRKSASMSTLPSPGLGGHSPALVHSPAAPSPSTSSNKADSRRVSRIPEPVFTNGHLTRPRQERDNSATSLVTMIKRSEENARSSGSTVSVPLTPMTSRDESMDGKHGSIEVAKRRESGRRVVSSCSPSMRAPFVVQVQEKRRGTKPSLASSASWTSNVERTKMENETPR